MSWQLGATYWLEDRGDHAGCVKISVCRGTAVEWIYYDPAGDEICHWPAAVPRDPSIEMLATSMGRVLIDEGEQS